MKSFFVKNFGCKVNQYEGELVAVALEAAGYRKSSELSDADVIVINTCVVTHRGERDALRWVRKALRERKDGAVVGVIGCLPSLKSVDAVDFQGGYKDFLKYLGINVPSITPYQHRARPFLKVQEGRNFRCSYCIVPRVRGRSRSRPLDKIIDEAIQLRDSGYEEIVITGTQVGDWGKEWGANLTDLLEELLKVQGVRYRLSSILPLHVTDRLIELMASHPDRIAPHLHISLQSASDRILAMMRRPYRLREFDAIIRKLVDSIPNIAIGTDIIVGFPTETEQDYEATRAYIQSSPICHIHVFEYSRRPGTEAEKWPSVPQHIRKKRVKELIDIAHRKKVDYISKFIGKVLHVVAEKQVDASIFQGTSENYIRVMFEGKGLRHGRIYPVKITDLDDITAVGEVSQEL